jgi:hypothetical protein
LEPSYIHSKRSVGSDIENSIISLLTQIVRDDSEIKHRVGKVFIPLSGKRLIAIKEYRDIKKKHDAALWRKEEHGTVWEVDE